MCNILKINIGVIAYIEVIITDLVMFPHLIYNKAVNIGVPL